MFNKEARFMKSYIRKTGYNTVTTPQSKNAYKKSSNPSTKYSCTFDLGKVTSLVCNKLYTYEYWSGGESGPDYSEGRYLRLALRKNGVQVWYYDCKSGRTYTPNVEADELYFYGYVPSGSWSSAEYELNVDINYETSTTTPYTYVVKY